MRSVRSDDLNLGLGLSVKREVECRDSTLCVSNFEELNAKDGIPQQNLERTRRPLRICLDGLCMFALESSRNKNPEEVHE